jgi:structural maintenance of chromosome 4
MSTACGYLDFLVVETEAGGAQCIEHLRKHNLGRVSLIVLERMGQSARAMEQPFKVRRGGFEGGGGG